MNEELYSFIEICGKYLDNKSVMIIDNSQFQHHNHYIINCLSNVIWIFMLLMIIYSYTYCMNTECFRLLVIIPDKAVKQLFMFLEIHVTCDVNIDNTACQMFCLLVIIKISILRTWLCHYISAHLLLSNDKI